jgi:hypothetical protein
MFKEGYEIFVRNLEELEREAGQEKEVEVRDCPTYQTKVVRALISPPMEKLEGGEPLWVRALVGHLLDEQPWWIKITQLIEER